MSEGPWTKYRTEEAEAATGPWDKYRRDNSLLDSALGGVAGIAEGFGSAIEGVGRSTGIDTLADIGASVAESAGDYADSKSRGMRRMDEVEDAGSALEFAGDIAAQNAPQMGLSLAGGAAGAAAGSIFGPVGTVVGGVLGGIGVNLPYFYGTNRERQKDVLEATGQPLEVDESAAFFAGVGQAAVDSVVDRFIVGKFLKPQFLNAGGLFTRITKNAATGAAVEVPTEIGQAMIERYQAGLPLDSDDAFEEYVQAGVAAGILGGGVGGLSGISATKPAADSGVSAGDTPPDQTAALKTNPLPTKMRVNDPAAPELGIEADSPLHNVEVEVDPDQSDAPTNMIKVILPDGRKTVIGNRLLVPVETSAATASQGVEAVAPDAQAALGVPEADIARSVLGAKKPAPAAAPAMVAAPAPAPAPATAPAPVATDTAVQAETPAEAVAQGETPAPEVTPEVTEEPTAESEGDTLPTVPEAPETLEVQAAALADRKNPRRAVWIPDETIAAGGVVTPSGNGIRAMPLDGGVLYWNQTKTGLGPRAIEQLYKRGNLGQLLGLGPITKADVAASAAQGNPPVAVTERTPDGVEVKAAAGTVETAPEQMAALEAEAAPENTVQVEAPQNVIAQRLAARQPANPVRQVEITPEVRARYERPAAPVTPEVTPEPAPAAPPAERAKQVSRARSQIEELPDGRRVIRMEPTAEEQALIDEATDRAAAARSAPSDVLRQNVDRSAQIESANKGEPETVEAELAARRGFAEDKNAKREAAAVENAVKTQKLFEDMAPKEIENIRSIRDAALVYQRLEATLKEAKKRGITVIKRVLPSHTNAQAWLSSVDKMASKLARMSKNPTEKTRMAVMGDLATFLSNEFIFVDTGDATDLRASRAEEGTAAMARGPSKGGADITESAADENAETGEEALIANEDATEEEIESVPDEVTDDADTEDDEPDVPEVPDVPQPTIRESDPEPVDATPSGVQFDEEGKPVFRQRVAVVETRKKRVLVGRPVKPLPFKRLIPEMFETGKAFVADVFHGTSSDIRVWDKAALGATTKAGSAREAFFFAKGAETANGYAALTKVQEAAKQELVVAFRKFLNGEALTDTERGNLDAAMERIDGVKNGRALYDEITQGVTEGRIAGGDITRAAEQLAAAFRDPASPNIQMARIQMKNPLVYDFKGSKYREDKYVDLIKKAKDEGHDGVVFLNTYDVAGKTGDQLTEADMDDIFAVFEPEQISQTYRTREPGQIFPMTDADADDDTPTTAEVLSAIGKMSDRATVTSFREIVNGITGKDILDALTEKNTTLSPREAQLQRRIAPEIAKALVKVAGDTEVQVLSDRDFDLIFPKKMMGVYVMENDTIYVRMSVGKDKNALVHIMLHEGSHAAFEAAIESNPQLKKQLTKVFEKSLEHALATGYSDSRYGFKDIHEFLSEAWSNPQFQEFLSTVPLSMRDRAELGLRGPDSISIKSVMLWLKNALANVLGIKEAFAAAGYPSTTKSAMEAALDIGGRLLELSPQARALYAGNPTVRPSIELDPSPGSIEGKLRSRGLSPVQAKNVAEVIANEFGGKATDADLDAIAQKIALAMTGQTPSAGGSTGSPKIDKATKEADAPEGKDATGWRAFLLKLRTLDDIVRTYGDRFKDKQGNALLDYLNAVFSYEPVRRQVEDRHNIDFAEFEDFRKANPEEAKKLSDLITEIAPFDVNLGPNADNSHLDGNAKANLQAKARLPELQAQYDALSPEAKALMEKMSENYRQSHNDAVRGVVYNTLALLDKKLSNSEVMRLMEAAVEGKLTDADKDTIDNDMVFQTLVNARELRLRKGLYFPSVRFGDFVVTTETTIDDPGITKVTLKTGRKSKANPGKALPTVPVTSEVTGGTVRFFVDPDVRGARTALDRTVSDWVSKQDLPLASYRIKYRDRTTGELVTKSNQRPDRDYDYVIEVNFQNKGVHFFETESEAKTFARDAAQDVVNGVLTNASVVMSRHNTQDLGNVIKGSVAEALMRSFDARNTDDDGTKTRRAQAQALLQEIIAQQLPGNRYEKRLLKRKNVAGYSQEIGRAAAHYGRQIGNYIAAVQTGPARHEAFDRILEIERERGAKDGVLSQVVNELRSREQEVGQNHHTSQLADNLVMINGWDKLASAANWLINGTQVVTNSLAVLGGRHGNGASVKALTAAYSKIGTASTLARGVRNTATAVTQVGNNELDTEDLVANIRKNLGQKYHDLVDAMTETGDVATDVGIESATTLSSGAGKFTKGVAKVDRIVRQMPNTMEAINRMVTAVAAYDLARKDGMSHKDAIAYAQDVTRQTQGRYDLANSPVWMQRAGVLRFALVFKKYAQLQYQLLGDILRRAFSGATPEEKAVAAKQFGNLMGINLAIGGLLGLPGIEAAKLVALAGMAFGGEEWDEWQERWREMVRGVVGEDIEQAINKGALSKVLDVDLQSRMGWQDLVTGFAPKALDPEGLTSFIGTTILGAPGGMAVDMLRAREAWQDGEVLKALGFLIPIKQVVDATKTVRGVSEGEMTAGDAIRQVIGFRSLRQAEIGDRLGSEIRDSKERRSDRESLEKAWMNADTPAEVAKAAAAIRRYNEALPEGQRKISIDALRRYKANDRARFN